MKRNDTIELENLLYKQTREKRIYGCSEVTIGFPYQNYGGKGQEIVDFITMDSRGILKCYEIKVTLQDLKSKAKKSWYGHYNYLVVSRDLYNTVYISGNNIRDYVPQHVGIIVGERLENIKKATKLDITDTDKTMLKESMIRSMYRKMDLLRMKNEVSEENFELNLPQIGVLGIFDEINKE